MSSNILFRSPDVWDSKRPDRNYEPFRTADSFAPCENDFADATFNKVVDTPVAKVKPCPGMVSAISAYAAVHCGSECCGYGITENGEVFSHYMEPGEAVHTYMQFTDDSWKAICIDDYGTEAPYIVSKKKNDSGRSPRAAHFGLLAYVLNKTVNPLQTGIQNVLIEEMNNLNSAVQSGSSDALKWAKILSAEMYQIMTYETSYMDTYSAMLVDTRNYSDMPNKLDLKKKVAFKEVYGDMSVFQQTVSANGIGNAAGITRIAELKGKFDPDPARVLSEMEQSMIPNIDESYQIPDKLIYVADLIKESTSKPRKLRNLILSGPAGTGKTEWSKILA